MNDAKYSNAEIASLLDSIDRRSDAGRVIRALLADRDRLARECNVHALNCAHLRAELSAARAALALYLQAGFGNSTDFELQHEAYRAALPILYGATPSAGGPQS